jgi:hypothetical protein
MIWVRAHYQCAVCGQVVMACCNGETALACPLEADAPRSDAQPVAHDATWSFEQPGEGN